MPEAADVLKELSDRTGETASIGMRRGDEVLILLRVPSTKALRYTGTPGSRTPLLESAIGRAIGAFSAFAADPVTEVAAVLTRAYGDALEPWATEVDLLATQLRGYAVVDDPHDRALRAIAAPVVGSSEHVRMGVEIQERQGVGPADR